MLEREEREVGGVVDVGRVADAGRHDQERGLRHDDLRPSGRFFDEKITGSIKITTHLDHISRFIPASGTHW